MIFLAILVPPLYFLVRKKWISLLLTMFFMAYSTLLVVTIVMSPVILVLWGLSAAWAVLDDIDHAISRQEPPLAPGTH
jgi:hypothetical protein